MITFKLAEAFTVIFRTLKTLTSVHCHLSQPLERALSPICLISLDKLLQERLSSISNTQSTKDSGRLLDTLFMMDGYKLLTQAELEAEGAKALESYDKVLVVGA